MGLWFSRLLNVFGDREARILVLGLDNAGKTTILCKWCRLPDKWLRNVDCLFPDTLLGPQIDCKLVKSSLLSPVSR